MAVIPIAQRPPRRRRAGASVKGTALLKDPPGRGGGNVRCPTDGKAAAPDPCWPGWGGGAGSSHISTRCEILRTVK